MTVPDRQDQRHDSSHKTAKNYFQWSFSIINRGVRIVEFESEKMMIRGRKINAEVELWDCGGDKRCTEQPTQLKRKVSVLYPMSY